MNGTGETGEALALQYLVERGLRLIERNYRCRYGEIDLVLQDGKTIVFAEVRVRRNGRFGGAAASVTTSKQQKLIAAAQHYLSRMRTAPVCRFDGIALDSLDSANIDWIRNAFGE
jgi:putative endonuclease